MGFFSKPYLARFFATIGLQISKSHVAVNSVKITEYFGKASLVVPRVLYWGRHSHASRDARLLGFSGSGVSDMAFGHVWQLWPSTGCQVRIFVCSPEHVLGGQWSERQPRRPCRLLQEYRFFSTGPYLHFSVRDYVRGHLLSLIRELFFLSRILETNVK